MTRREAALILGVREGAPEEKIKEAHRRIMIANHPDSGAVQCKNRVPCCVCIHTLLLVPVVVPMRVLTVQSSGGSGYIAIKVNEAKDMLLGKRRSGGSVF